MAVTRIKNSGIKTGVLKYDSALAGLPGVMPTPTAADAALGGTVNVSFSTISGLTSYGVISNPGNITATGSSSPIAVSGLTDGTAYTFQIRGVNTSGTGAYSAPSNAATPTGSAYYSIASVTPSGTGTVTFSSIPSTYKHLELRYSYFGNNGFASMRVNGATGNSYQRQIMYGTNGGGAGIYKALATTWIAAGYNGNDTTATYPTVAVWRFLDYTNTSFQKNIVGYQGVNDNTTTSGKAAVDFFDNGYLSTSAISSIEITNGGTFSAGSVFSLYGIMG